MTQPERSSLGYVEKIISDRNELQARTDAADQLGGFLCAALCTLGEKEGDGADAYMALYLPLTEEGHWRLVVEAKARGFELGDKEVPISLRVWKMHGDMEDDPGDNEASSEITIRQTSKSQWAAVLGGANVEKPVDGYNYAEFSNDYQWPLDDIIGLTRTVVDAVKRYEQQNGITAPPA